MQKRDRAGAVSCALRGTLILMGGQVGNKGKIAWDMIAADRRRRN